MIGMTKVDYQEFLIQERELIIEIQYSLREPVIDREKISLMLARLWKLNERRANRLKIPVPPHKDLVKRKNEIIELERMYSMDEPQNGQS
jgi:hypothetical protein